MKESSKKNNILGHHKNIIGLLFPDPIPSRGCNKNCWFAVSQPTNQNCPNLKHFIWFKKNC
jgi:hypothetical protein